MIELQQVCATVAETRAFNAGVEAMRAIARSTAERLRSKPWRPAREGAADALAEIAEAGAELKIGHGNVRP